MTTLRDLARATGYSVTTVSRALRGFDDVAEATRRRIEEAARAMSYRPHQVARKLVTGRSGMVGLILEAPPKPFEYGHFFELVAGLSMAFSARGLDFVLHVGDGTGGLVTHERLLSRGALDGFVLTFPVSDDPRIELLLDRDAPFVVHGHHAGDERYAYFDDDNFEVSRLAVDVLATAGHRRIGLIAGPPAWPSVAERMRGYREAMARWGMASDPALVVHGDTSGRHGTEALGKLLALGPARPSAVVCCNSLVAAGVYERARREGLAIPDDLSVFAHDDALPQVQTDALDPPLSVTRISLRDAAEPLAGLLVRRISGEPSSSLQVTRQPELIAGASVGPPSPGR